MSEKVFHIEQTSINNLTANTKAELIAHDPVTIVDVLTTDEGADVDFEPARLGLTARTAELYRGDHHAQTHLTNTAARNLCPAGDSPRRVG